MTLGKGYRPWLAVLGVAACAAETLTDVPPDAQEVAFDQIQEIHTSAYSAIIEPARLVITDGDDWAEFWQHFHQSLDPTPPVPQIDFTQRMVLVAAMGQRNSGGYAITVQGVYEDGDRLIVEVLERSPGASCVTTAALTAPVTAVVTDRWNGDVAWVESTTEVEC